MTKKDVELYALFWPRRLDPEQGELEALSGSNHRSKSSKDACHPEQARIPAKRDGASKDPEGVSSAIPIQRVPSAVRRENASAWHSSGNHFRGPSTTRPSATTGKAFPWRSARD